MFEFSSKIVNKSHENFVIKKNISLDKNLDCFIHIDSKSKNFGESFLNKIVDHIIDKISTKNTYGDFSIALENINAYIKAWNTDNEVKEKANVIIGILDKNTFIFSNIGSATAYLINKNAELVSLTDHKNHKDTFSYISNGDLKNDEIIIISSSSLLTYLSQSDIIDGLDKENNLDHFTSNIKQILETDNTNENIIFSGLKYHNGKNIENSKNKYLILLQEKSIELLDTGFIKKIIAHSFDLKHKIIQQSKTVKNSFFIVIVVLCVFFLYSSLSSIVSVTTNNKEKEVNIEKLEQAKNFIRQASDNVANPNAFAKSIQDAEDIISDVKSEEVFLSDLEKMQDNINILKKQFNKIESFDDNQENQIYAGNFENFVKIVNKELKPYIIEKKSVTGPINSGTIGKKYINSQLDNDEYFIDATVIGDDIYISTSKSKVVRFAKTGYFSFVDVQGQDTWANHKGINSYNGNLYLTAKNNAQIYRHAPSGRSFAKGSDNLNQEDITSIGNILSIAIDGGFYILKEGLIVQKFFASPKYEMVNIVLNNLPKNYEIENNESKIDIKTRAELNYVYILLNNKIFVFEPNSRNFRDTTSLTYVGQIEGGNNKIIDFQINHDGELWIINNTGIYDMSFEISDNKLILR